jgi:acyl-CoA reductase-like NAD-dependent aldehyde dehydrogenase
MSEGLKGFQMYINGEFVEAESGERMSAFCPSDGDKIATFPKGGPADIDKAVAAAKDLFETTNWGKNHESENRGDLLRRIAAGIRDNIDELAELEALDSGKTIMDVSLVDIHYAADCF